jgi:hypothetical protein
MVTSKLFRVVVLCWFFVLFFLIGASYLRDCHSNSTKIIQGQTTIRDTVLIHDTLTNTITRDKIRVERKIDTVRIGDTVAIDSNKICYSAEKTYERGAYVRASVCSKFFELITPEDLEMNIRYVPPFDSIKIITRIDTTPPVFIYKKPIIPTWQAVTLGIVGGIVIGWVSLKNIK